MTREFKQKMRDKADVYVTKTNNNDCTVDAFVDGAEAMYEELKPIVEWIDVNKQLPKPFESVIVMRTMKIKTIKKSTNKTYNDFLVAFFDADTKRWKPIGMNYFNKDEVTHWRKIFF